MPGLGDEQGLGAAYAAYGAELYRFVPRGLGDAGAAQDVVQETFLRAWRAADRFDPALASLRVWLFAIARNAMVDHARAARARPRQGTVLDSSVGRAPGRCDRGRHRAPGQLVGRRGGAAPPVRGAPDGDRADPPAGAAVRRGRGRAGRPGRTVRSRVFYGLKALRVAMDEMGVTL